MDRLLRRVVLEAVLAHQHHVVPELLRVRVLLRVELLAHSAQVHGVLDDVVVVGEAETLHVDWRQEGPVELLRLLALHLVEELLAVLQLLRELALVARLQLAVVDVHLVGPLDGTRRTSRGLRNRFLLVQRRRAVGSLSLHALVVLKCAFVKASA